MKITAEKLAKQPAQAYREADKGNTVTINHDRYPDKVFELTARERRAKPASEQAYDLTSADS
jgi:TfoX/Sxy family transcriptional regulator of competence genes